MKKKILHNLFPFLKLKDDKLSRLQKVSAYVESVLFFVLIFWIIWYIWGYERLFNHKYINDKLSIYTTYELNNEQVSGLVNRIKKKLNQSDIVLKNLNASIYITDNPLYYYSILYPGFQILYSKSSAYTIGNVVRIKKITLEEFNKNLILLNDKNFTLDNLLSHELVHVWQNKKYGNTLFSQWFILPKWVMEGYAVYISEKERIFNKPKEKIKHFLEKNKALSSHIRRDGAYTLWAHMIKHAIEHMHKSVDDLHLGKVEYDEVMESLLKEYNLSKE